MILILVGAPGGGKGTQAAKLKEQFKIAHISTGDMLRENVKAGTALGAEANGFMQSGALVPDALIIKMIEARIKDADCKNGFLLDGFPRSLPQAEALDKMLTANKLKLDAVINLQVDEDELVKRLLSRGRADDNEKTIRNRLQVFKTQTEPVLGHYGSQKRVKNIHGMGAIDEIYTRILEALK
ncbi:MAG: adenylate kinase [Spirochaetes bacterium]|nr:adenylate kinase [Spirochaetota bacterium]